MYSLAVYIPESHLEEVKSALFAAGAGRIGNYDSCAWQVRGEGQFRALEGANPNIGKIGAVEHVAEVKVELVCSDAVVKNVIAALKKAHPYETPAFIVTKSSDI